MVTVEARQGGPQPHASLPATGLALHWEHTSRALAAQPGPARLAQPAVAEKTSEAVIHPAAAAQPRPPSPRSHVLPRPLARNDPVAPRAMVRHASIDRVLAGVDPEVRFEHRRGSDGGVGSGRALAARARMSWLRAGACGAPPRVPDRPPDADCDREDS